MNIEQQKKYIEEHLKQALLEKIDHRITPTVLNNILESTKKVLAASNQLDNINDHIETIVKQNPLDAREILVQFKAKDAIGASFLTPMKDE